MQSHELGSLKARFLAAQLGGQRREALRLVVDDGLGRGASVGDLRRDVIAAAQAEIGQLWQENRISVADEHMATAISQLALAHLYQHAGAEKRLDKSVVVACVEGEQHDFPARLVADALDLAGYDVRYLGASVPLDHLRALLRQKPPDLVVLSVTMSFNVSSARDAVARLRSEFPTVKLAVGGGACRFSPELCKELQSDATASDSEELVKVVHQLLGVRP